LVHSHAQIAADRDRLAGPPLRPVGRDGPEEVEGLEEEGVVLRAVMPIP